MTALAEAPVSEEQLTMWDMEPERWHPTGWRDTDDATERALSRPVECAECPWTGTVRDLVDASRGEPMCPECGWTGVTL